MARIKLNYKTGYDCQIDDLFSFHWNSESDKAATLSSKRLFQSLAPDEVNTDDMK